MVQTAILVLNWNGLENTHACLKSCPTGVRRYVLNNGCRAEERYIAHDVDTAALDTPRNVGFAAGVNVLIGQALGDGADWVLLLNNDARLGKGALATMLGAVAPDIAAICPAVVDTASSKVWSIGGRVNLWLGRTTSEFHGIAPDRTPTTPKDVDFGTGAAILLSGVALSRVGGLDETYFAYWEETDWCWRARGSGYRVMTCPRARVSHKGGASSRPSLRVHLMIRNAILFMRRHGRPWHWLTFVPAVSLFSIPLWSARALLEEPWPTLRAISAAIAWHLGRIPRPETAYATAQARHGAVLQAVGSPASDARG